jgi:predicted ArsR family transcriptional regulator
MHETRKQIIDILQRRGPCSVNTIVEHLTAEGLHAVSAVTVRYHLRTLQTEGLICTPDSVQSGGRGRPQHLYSLAYTESDLHDAFRDRVLRELMTSLSRAGEGGASVETVLRQAATTLMDGEIDAQASIADRVSIAVDFLNARGYQAAFEALSDAAGWVITTKSCPFSTLQAGSLTLPIAFCQIDFLLIEALVGHSVQRLTRIAGDDADCSYFIEAKVEIVN